MYMHSPLYCFVLIIIEAVCLGINSTATKTPASNLVCRVWNPRNTSLVSGVGLGNQGVNSLQELETTLKEVVNGTDHKEVIGQTDGSSGRLSQATDN